VGSALAPGATLPRPHSSPYRPDTDLALQRSTAARSGLILSILVLMSVVK